MSITKKMKDLADGNKRKKKKLESEIEDLKEKLEIAKLKKERDELEKELREMN